MVRWSSLKKKTVRSSTKSIGSKSKYHNRKTDGFDSAKERRRYGELVLMQKAGLISDLKCQVEFVLVPKQQYKNPHFTHTKKGKPKHMKTEREIRYVADFTYTDENGDYVVEDVKGFLTSEFVMKRKLMLFLKGIEIKET